MEQGPGAPAAGGDPLGEHVDDRVEIGARQVGVRPRAPAELVERVLIPLVAGRSSDDLLREHVERGVPQPDGVDVGAPGRADQRRALDQLVPGEREETTLGRGGQRVAGAPDPLQPGGDGPRRTDQATELDRAHVDAELQRRGRHDDLEVARFQQALRPMAALAGEAAVVGCHALGAQALAQMQRHALDQATRVDEHQRRFVLARQGRDPVVERRPLFVRRHRAELVLRHLDAQIEIAPLADVDQRRRGSGPTHQQPRRDLERPHRRRQTEALELGRTHQGVQPLEGQRQMGAALVGGHGVNFVDDHRPHIAQRPPARVGGEQNEERLGGGHEDVGRTAGCLAPFPRRRVAGPDGGPNLRRRVAQLGRQRLDLSQRLFEIPPHVVRQRLERRNIKDAGPVGEGAARRDRLADQSVERPEKRGQRLARSRRRGDQNVLARRDQRPGLGLRRRRRAELPLQPPLNHRVKHLFSILRDPWEGPAPPAMRSWRA